MPEQNFKNHARMVPLFHYVASVLILIPFVISTIHFFKSIMEKSGRVNAAATVSLITGIIIVYWFSRVFALKAQDRAIRAEENFRHFIATGKPLDSRLRMGQIIALRFAGDSEFVALAKKAVDENMGAKDIKMAIQNWRADHNRA
jgi:Family of unknown function (DUF6526)